LNYILQNPSLKNPHFYKPNSFCVMLIIYLLYEMLIIYLLYEMLIIYLLYEMNIKIFRVIQSNDDNCSKGNHEQID
jgi:hypothetical protein